MHRAQVLQAECFVAHGEARSLTGGVPPWTAFSRNGLPREAGEVKIIRASEKCSARVQSWSFATFRSSCKCAGAPAQQGRAWCCAEGEGWEDHTVPLLEFRSEEAMRDFLPPQLLAALALAKVMLQHSRTVLLVPWSK